MRPGRKIVMGFLFAGAVAISASQALAADSGANSGLVDQGDGILKQTATGLEWTQSDNGSDIDWNAAGKHCADRGADWRLPSVEELLSLYDRSGSVSTSCGPGFTCMVSPLFRLTGPWAWSNEASNSMSTWIVILTRGNTNTYVVTDGTKKRALCVRNS